jgi:hypothetical protein
MADPNASPVGDDAGTLAPDPAKLQSDIGSIEADYEPRVKAEVEQAQGFEQQAVSAEQDVSKEAAGAASDITAQDEEMQRWVQSTPTRQAAYATSMHAAPVLAILTALGGKLTRLNGLQMLAATNGIVQGLNEASEKKYQDSMNAFNAAYEKMRDHQRRLMDAHKMMLTAYQGRADAYQKASEAARRMAGDILDDKQRKVAQTIDTFKAQQVAVNNLARLKFSYDNLHERTLQHIRQESHWKAIEQKSATMPPEIKAQIAAEHSRWQNAKAQQDENMKRRGQINNNLSMPDDQKTAAMARIDAEDDALTMEMNKAQSNTDAIVAGYEARGAAAPGARPGEPPAAPGAGQPPGSVTPDNPKGAAGRPGEPPAQASDTAPASDRSGVIQRYNSPEDVRTALASGLITREQAKQILVQKFGYN